MAILYVIVGALVVLSLGLWVLLRILNAKKQAMKMKKAEVQAMHAVAEAESQRERQFIPKDVSAE